MKYPILIGSQALDFHGVPNIKPRDIDIITDAQTAGELAWKCNKKEDKLLYFDNYVVDIALHDENPVKKLIYDLMNDRKLVPNPILFPIFLKNSVSAKPKSSVSATKFDSLIVSITEYTIECCVPPLEWLYCMIRGHLHRIPITMPTQAENIRLWEKHMSHYQAIRDKVGYKELDEKFKIDPIMTQIFNVQFDYINSLVGDAPSMEKAEADFFKDRVKRYIEHDELHRQVAQINRNSDELLFKRYQTNPKSVEMDETLFLSAPRQDQLNTIREELMVLFLERKLLPIVVEHNNSLDDLGYNEDYDFKQIVCHFMTNLCGTGHSWLRQWCLDHYVLFKRLETYPTSALAKFALTFNTTGKILGADIGTRINSLSEFIKYFKTISTHRANSTKDLGETISRKKPANNTLISKYNVTDDGNQLRRYNSNPFIKISKSHSLLDKSEYKYYQYSFIPYKFVLDINPESYPSELTDLVTENFLTATANILVVVREQLVIVYNYFTGLGLCLQKNHQSYVFLIETKLSYQVSYGIHSYMFDPKINTDEEYKAFKESFATNSRTVYSTYYNSDCYGESNSTYYNSDCYGESNRAKEIRFIGRYGSSRPELEEVLEFMARVYLSLPVDEKSDTE